jgi:hypothetical protein
MSRAALRSASSAALGALLVSGLMMPSASAQGLAGAQAAGSHLQVLSATTGQAAGTDVTLTPKTIVLTPAEVSSSLSSVSAGTTFTFSNDNGPLAQVVPGKVLLLEGQDAIVVKTVKHDGAKLIVGAAPASLTDVVQSGNISVKGAPDIAAAVGVPLDPAQFGNKQPSYGLEAPAANDSNTFAYQGTLGGFTYKLGFTKKADGLHATGDFCYQLVASSSGSTCGNGLSANITLDGTFTWADEDVNVGVGGGAVHSGSFSISNMSSEIDLNYAVLRNDEPKVGADPPVIKIPFAFEAPLCGTPLGCAGLPLYSKFELALLVKLGISAKNSTIQGGVKLTIGGSGSVSGSKLGSVSGSVTGGSAKGAFTLGSALTPGASGVVVALQNKFGVGLGVTGINALYYISAITSIGETTGSLVAGESCKAFVGDFLITGNFEAQLFGLTVSSPAKTLFEKKASYKQPPC